MDSSCIHRLRYHKRRRTLDLEYPDGERYEYREVTPQELTDLKRAESIGKFVNQQIKKHRYRKLNAS